MDKSTVTLLDALMGHHPHGDFSANANISEFLSEADIAKIQSNVEEACKSLLAALCIDTSNDHNTKETAKRMAKMYVKEVFSGRYEAMPKLTDFPNAKSLDEVYTLGPIAIRSACSHHLVPIIGQMWIGILPSEKVVGISKFVRLARWIMSRPHIQEEAAVMMADAIEKAINPKGLAIVIKAQHMCMTWRGVQEAETSMVNSIVRGKMRDDASLRKEFFDIIKGQGFTND